MRKIVSILSITALLSMQYNCSSSDGGGSPAEPENPTNPTNPGVNEVNFYKTTGDQSAKLSLQSTILDFGTTTNSYNTIEVSDATTYQTVDGFGYTLTGGSVQVINTLAAAKKQELLNDLFSANGIGVSYLRISIGASDLNAAPFTYDDMPAGQTDTSLNNFSIAPDA
ncbi:MAG: glucosylceramidase, partial [Bacteroidota bacterium]